MEEALLSSSPLDFPFAFAEDRGFLGMHWFRGCSFQLRAGVHLRS